MPCHAQNFDGGSRETQNLLYYLIARDDIELLRSTAGEWIRCLYALDWREFRTIGAQYYQGLWEFNIAAARLHALRQQSEPNPELEDDAEQ